MYTSKQGIPPNTKDYGWTLNAPSLLAAGTLRGAASQWFNWLWHDLALPALSSSWMGLPLLPAQKCWEWEDLRLLQAMNLKVLIWQGILSWSLRVKSPRRKRDAGVPNWREEFSLIATEGMFLRRPQPRIQGSPVPRLSTLLFPY